VLFRWWRPTVKWGLEIGRTDLPNWNDIFWTYKTSYSAGWELYISTLHLFVSFLNFFSLPVWLFVFFARIPRVVRECPVSCLMASYSRILDFARKYSLLLVFWSEKLKRKRVLHWFKRFCVSNISFKNCASLIKILPWSQRFFLIFSPRLVFAASRLSHLKRRKNQEKPLEPGY